MNPLIKSPLGLLSLALALGLVLPLLMMDGMFMDAVLYSAVAHNLSQGIGSFWFPFFSTEYLGIHSGFHEQPPLGLWMMSLPYRVFGSSIYVERFYILGCYLIHMWLIIKIWITALPHYKKIAWLPVLLWSIIPTVFWSFRHNMMENTMGIFVLLAVWCLISSQKQGKLFYAGLGGIFLWCAFMVKGVPGLYPLAIPVLFFLVYRNITWVKAITYFLIPVTVVISGIVVLFLFPESNESMSNYLFDRLLGRIDSWPTVTNRAQILLDFFTLMLLPLAIVLLIGFLSKGKSFFKSKLTKDFWFFALTALCGVVPLTLTLVQRGFYLTPAFPIAAIALAVPISELIVQFQDRLAIKAKINRALKYLAGIVILGVIVITVVLAGEPKRDKKILEEVYAIGKIIGEPTQISTPIEVSYNWTFKAYLMRYYQIQLGSKAFRESVPPEKYVLMPTGSDIPFSDYQKVPIGLINYQLYERVGKP